MPLRPRPKRPKSASRATSASPISRPRWPRFSTAATICGPPMQRARAIAPHDPSVLAMGASIKADYDRDLEGALADLYASVEQVPSSTTWNDIGLILDSRNAPVEAEAAFRRAIALDPEDPIAYGNLAILLLDQSRVDEAGALLHTALALDPANPSALTFYGRYLLQTGHMQEALASMLAGSAANPAGSDALLALADTYFQMNDLELAGQALDNADRLDPHAAIVAILRTAFALDGYRADEAIVAAREALRRSRARGGDFAGISVSRQSGSYPVEAYRFINLHDWARFYADRTFDPFQATGYLDQAIVNRPGVFVAKPTLSTVEGSTSNSSFYSLQVQGLLLDPLGGIGSDRTLRPAPTPVRRRRSRRRPGRARWPGRLPAGRHPQRLQQRAAADEFHVRRRPEPRQGRPQLRPRKPEGRRVRDRHGALAPRTASLSKAPPAGSGRPSSISPPTRSAAATTTPSRPCRAWPAGATPSATATL